MKRQRDQQVCLWRKQDVFDAFVMVEGAKRNRPAAGNRLGYKQNQKRASKNQLCNQVANRNRVVTVRAAASIFQPSQNGNVGGWELELDVALRTVA